MNLSQHRYGAQARIPPSSPAGFRGSQQIDEFGRFHPPCQSEFQPTVGEAGPFRRLIVQQACRYRALLHHRRIKRILRYQHDIGDIAPGKFQSSRSGFHRKAGRVEYQRIRIDEKIEKAPSAAACTNQQNPDEGLVAELRWLAAKNKDACGGEHCGENQQRPPIEAGLPDDDRRMVQ